MGREIEIIIEVKILKLHMMFLMQIVFHLTIILQLI
jgi:hypothetical protein